MPKSRRDRLPTFIKTQAALLALSGTTAREMEVQVGGAAFKDIYGC